MASDTKRPTGPVVGRVSTNRVYIGVAPSLALGGAFMFGYVDPLPPRPAPVVRRRPQKEKRR
jgi:hypothetical protein